MKCSYCQSDVTGASKFCPNCGAELPIQQPQEPVQPTYTPEPYFQPSDNIQNNNTNNNNRRKKTSTSSTIILILLIVIAVGCYKFFTRDNGSSSSDGPSTETLSNNNNNNGGMIVTTEDSFQMYIEDVFTISGRGTIVTGRITRGSIKLGDKVQVIGLDKDIIDTEVTSIEMFRKELDEAQEGDNVGLLLKDVERAEVERGQTVIAVNSMRAYKEFKATIHVLSADEGGRKSPIYDKDELQFYFYTSNVTGEISLPAGVDEVNPGDDVTVTVKLDKSVALEAGSEFTIREGGRTLGNGTVEKGL